MPVRPTSNDNSDRGPAPVGSISGIKHRPAPGPRVPAFGPVPSPLLVLGERPGEDEYKQGRPFIGASGRVLADWFERAELALDNFRLTNVVNDYRAGNPEPAAWEIERDWRRVVDEIMECQPVVIAAVGAHAVRWCLGDGHDLDTVHGVPIKCGTISGRPARRAHSLRQGWQPHRARDPSPFVSLFLSRVVS